MTLAVSRMLSGDLPIELGTGSSVNSGSKCRRSLGPLYSRKEKPHLTSRIHTGYRAGKSSFRPKVLEPKSLGHNMEIPIIVIHFKHKTQRPHRVELIRITFPFGLLGL